MSRKSFCVCYDNSALLGDAILEFACCPTRKDAEKFKKIVSSRLGFGGVHLIIEKREMKEFETIHSRELVKLWEKRQEELKDEKSQ